MMIWEWFLRHRKKFAPPAAPYIHRLELHIIYPRHGRKRRMTLTTATIKWDIPTTRTDGSPLTPDQIAGFDIFDSASATPDVAIGSVAGAGGSFTTDLLAVGVHNFTVVARDTVGHSSAASNAASVTVEATLANPSPPANVTATLNP